MRRRRSLAAAVVAALLGLSVVSAGGAVSADGDLLRPTGSSRGDLTTRVQRVTVEWSGSWRNPTYVKTAVIPGIGHLDLICRPNDTRIRLYTADRDRETQMWLQKYEIKEGRRVVAVKVPRIYRYAHAADDGTGGTGFYAHEGLNQLPRIENRSQDGYLYGVISQRAGRQQSGAALNPPPVTTFELTWFWNGFDHPQPYRYCKIDAVLTTQLQDRAVLTWHGDQDPAPVEQTRQVPGIGALTLTCEKASDPGRDRYLTIRPDKPSALLYIETVTGEGRVEDHVDATELDVDPETGLLGPIPLPVNGTLRLRATSGATTRWLLVSSYRITNDVARPHRNLCEVAAGYYQR